MFFKVVYHYYNLDASHAKFHMIEVKTNIDAWFDIIAYLIVCANKELDTNNYNVLHLLLVHSYAS